MIINIDNDNGITLEESDNFKGFHITIGDTVDLSSCEPFLAISAPADEGRYWLDADKVIEIGGKSADQAWQEQFWGMLKSVEKYGFADLEKRRVKAHVAS